MHRITFNEITKTAVKESLKASACRSIWIWWMHSRQDVCWTVWWVTGSVRFCGQRSRRGLSAGRVQSVTLRIIADREEEIECLYTGRILDPGCRFYDVPGERKPLTAKFYGTEKEKMNDSFKRRAGYRSLKELEGAKYQVAEVKKGERTKKAPLPFTTSTLAAGSFQGAEFLHTENHACCTAAYMKEWI